MEIKRISSTMYRKIYNDLIKGNVDFVSYYDTIEDTYDIRLKSKNKILVSVDKNNTSILLTEKAVYIILSTTEYDTLTIF